MDGKPKVRVLYFHTGLSSMVKRDLQLISEFAEITSWHFQSIPKWKLPLSLIKQLKLLITARKYEVLICRFPGYHSVIPFLAAKLWNRKSVAIVGGTSCHYFPSIGYGNLTKIGYGWATKLSFNWVKVIAPNHQSLVEFDYNYHPQIPEKQGLINLFSQSYGKKVEIIPNGFDTAKFKILGMERPRDFLTVSAQIGPREYLMKGISLFLDLARAMPENTFTLCGNYSLKEAQVVLPKNVKLMGLATSDELVELYNEHKVYCQLSLAEGFPNALCEAMLCGCLPMVSKVFSMPELVGNENKFIIGKPDVEMLKSKAINVLADCTEVNAHKVSLQIATKYPLKVRADKLKEVLMNL